MSWIEEMFLSFNNSKSYDEETEYIADDGLIHCKKCKDKLETVITVEDCTLKVRCTCKCHREERERMKEQERQQEIERRRKVCFAESNMHDCTFENDDRKNEKISDAMMKYANEFSHFKDGGKGVLLYGETGTGKTYYAACIANELINRGYRVLMTNFARLTNILQSKQFEDKQAYIDDLKSYALLIIDDFGIERKSEYMQELVFSIIDSRYRSGLPMIVTTNLKLTAMLGNTDTAYSRVYERITERCIPVEVKGDSRRKNKVINDLAADRALLGL